MQVFYIQVMYKGSSQIYTFKTTIQDLQINDPVLVHDVGGYSIVRVVKISTYKPRFECRNVILGPKTMATLNTKIEQMCQAIFDSEKAVKNMSVLD